METYVVWEQYFQIKLPNMYVRISCQKEMSVPQLCSLQGGEEHWNLRFRRTLHDWSTQFQSLVQFKIKKNSKVCECLTTFGPIQNKKEFQSL